MRPMLFPFVRDLAGDLVGDLNVSKLVVLQPGRLSRSAPGYSDLRHSQSLSGRGSCWETELMAQAGGEDEEQLIKLLLREADAHASQNPAHVQRLQTQIQSAIRRATTPFQRLMKVYAELIGVMSDGQAPVDPAHGSQQQLERLRREFRAAGDLVGEALTTLVEALLIRALSAQSRSNRQQKCLLVDALTLIERAEANIESMRRHLTPEDWLLLRLQTLVYKARVVVDTGDARLGLRIASELQELEWELQSPVDRYDAVRSMFACRLAIVASRKAAEQLGPTLLRACWYFDKIDDAPAYSFTTCLCRILLWCDQIDRKLHASESTRLFEEWFANQDAVVPARDIMWQGLVHLQGHGMKRLAPLCFNVRTNAFTRDTRFLAARFT